jgi:peptidoglycan/xylan/chitin deacetylase (PgdA/CDA1 family)
MVFLVLVAGLICTDVAMAQDNHQDQGRLTPSFPWPGGKRAALSFTFDDARPSQIDNGLRLFNQYHIKVTFYVSPNRLSERLQGWKQAVDEGHEIGNHTLTHPCTSNYLFSRQNALEDFTLDRMARDIDDATQSIFEQLGVKPTSFAYPCGQSSTGRGNATRSYIPLVTERFLAARGWLGEASNDPYSCDVVRLLGMESDGKSFEELRALVDKAVREGRWLILAGHEIAQSGKETTPITSLEKILQYVRDPERRIWIDTVENVARHILETRKQ